MGIRYQLKENKLRQIASFSYETSNKEGWGAAFGHVDNHEVLFVSDGSCNIHVWDTQTLKEQERKCIVDENDHEVRHLNELEVIAGQLYANVWMMSKIAVIDWSQGRVVRWIDLSDLVRWVKLPTGANDRLNAVLNGIALDPSDNGIYVTGKQWNRLFKIHLVSSVSYKQEKYFLTIL